MKKLNYFIYSALSGICMMSLAACSEEDFGYDKEEIAYETHFVKQFGKPDPNHKWGFTPMEIVDHTTGITRAASPNANQWGDWGLDVPYPLSQVQKDFVTKYFEDTKNPNGIAVSWTDYFAQQVSSTEYGKHMDELFDNGTADNDHIYNFNSGEGSSNGSVTNPNVQGQYKDKIQYMTGQSTKAFSFNETVSSKRWYDHYVIVPGEWIDPTNSLASRTRTVVDEDGKVLKDKSGNTITTTESIWGMWFVAFDYEADKDDSDNDDVARDYYFNDWIVKISPGTYSRVAQRVMCEDLGNSFDWDFNDVVFDVNYTTDYSNGAKVMAHIVIQCAGGTLPIYVGTTAADKEVHKLLGDGSMNPIVQPVVSLISPAQYTIEVTDDWWESGLQSYQKNDQYANASMVPIYVNGVLTNNLAQSLQASAIPQKFSCPTNVMWSEELINICDTYPNFTKWVQDAGATGIWEYNPKKPQQNIVVEQ